MKSSKFLSESAMIDPKEDTEGKSVFETIKKRPLDKKKRTKNDNPEDINGFLGPWGGFEGEQRFVNIVSRIKNHLVYYIGLQEVIHPSR